MAVLPSFKDEFASVDFWRAVFAEFIGTLFFVFMALSATVHIDEDDASTQVLFALTIGFSIVVVVYALADVSGGHINPVVTSAMALVRNITVLRFLAYVLAQLLGAVTGAAILYGVTPADWRGGLGVTHVSDDMSLAQSFGVELMGTFGLVFTVFAACDKRHTNPGFPALAVGLSVAIPHLALAHYTGPSINPARSFGPALIMNDWEDQWIYWIGPFAGSSLAAFLYQYILKSPPRPPARRRPCHSKFIKENEGFVIENAKPTDQSPDATPDNM